MVVDWPDEVVAIVDWKKEVVLDCRTLAEVPTFLETLVLDLLGYTG